jgi:NAD+ synthase (glutamine-hydrolysing)
MTDRFFSIHAQGMVRVAAATPAASAGDVAANAASILDLARKGDAEGADLIVYPELCLNSYAIDDLHLQDALLDRVEGELAQLVAAASSASCPKATCPIIANITRSVGSRLGSALPA